jgi:hypothetical protein
MGFVISYYFLFSKYSEARPDSVVEINRAMHKMLSKATHQPIAWKIMMFFFLSFFLSFFMFSRIIGFASFNLVITIVVFLKQFTHAWTLRHDSTCLVLINLL